MDFDLLNVTKNNLKPNEKCQKSYLVLKLYLLGYNSWDFRFIYNLCC